MGLTGQMAVPRFTEWSTWAYRCFLKQPVESGPRHHQ